MSGLQLLVHVIASSLQSAAAQSFPPPPAIPYPSPSASMHRSRQSIVASPSASVVQSRLQLSAPSSQSAPRHVLGMTLPGIPYPSPSGSTQPSAQSRTPSASASVVQSALQVATPSSQSIPVHALPAPPAAP